MPTQKQQQPKQTPLKVNPPTSEQPLDLDEEVAYVTRSVVQYIYIPRRDAKNKLLSDVEIAEFADKLPDELWDQDNADDSCVDDYNTIRETGYSTVVRVVSRGTPLRHRIVKRGVKLSEEG